MVGWTSVWVPLVVALIGAASIVLVAILNSRDGHLRAQQEQDYQLKLRARDERKALYCDITRLIHDWSEMSRNFMHRLTTDAHYDNYSVTVFDLNRRIHDLLVQSLLIDPPDVVAQEIRNLHRVILACSSHALRRKLFTSEEEWKKSYKFFDNKLNETSGRLIKAMGEDLSSIGSS